MKHDSDILKRIKSYFMRRRSAEEAHAFEREIERDAFLYEAIEGYEDMLTSDIQQSLDELDDRLDDKTKRSGMLITWQAAAIAIIIAGGITTFIVISGNGDGSTESAPVATEEQDNNYRPRKSVSTFDSMDNIEDEAVAETDTILEETDSQGEELPVAVQELSKPNVDEDISPSPKEKKVEKPETTGSFEAENAGEEVADVPAETTSTKDVAMADDIEPGLLQKPAQMEEESAMTKNGRESASKAMSSTSSTSASPEGGMASYQTYLKKNLQRSPGMPSGKVVLSFEFDRDGAPKKIEVKNSLCTACDAEAIRLIEEGPKWDAEDRKQRTQVSVEF